MLPDGDDDADVHQCAVRGEGDTEDTFAFERRAHPAPNAPERILKQIACSVLAVKPPGFRSPVEGQRLQTTRR